MKVFIQFIIFIGISVLVLHKTWPFYTPNVTAQNLTSFVFTAAGDHDVGSNTDASINVVANSGSAFYLALGDLSYRTGGEQSWCNNFKSKFNDVEVLAGNHDVGESSGGNINNYSIYCPFTLPLLTGDYGKQYYFDYPQSGTPLARFIMIAPGVKGSLNIDYNVGGAGYNFTASAIDDARNQNIPWIIVGMHKNCISTGQKTCEVGMDIMNLLLNKKVDLILQGHDHNYQRSHQLKCIRTNTVDTTCITDNGSDGVYTKGGGSVMLINGEFGRPLYSVSQSDSEANYFATIDSTTFGVTKYTLSQTQLSAQYLRSAGGSFADSFMITTNPATPAATPTATTVSIATSTPIYTPTPTNIPPPAPTVSPEPTSSCPTLPSNSGTASTSISVNNPGLYKVWSRIMGTTTGNDSYWLKIDNTCAYNVGDSTTIPLNTWTWVDFTGDNTNSPILIDLSAGQHTVTLIGRESGVQIDRLLFTQDFTCTPTQTGDNCTGITITPTPSNNQGDINQDGAVNANDAFLVLTNWLSPQDTRADIDNNGVVNSFDFYYVMRDW